MLIDIKTTLECPMKKIAIFCIYIFIKNTQSIIYYIKYYSVYDSLPN